MARTNRQTDRQTLTVYLKVKRLGSVDISLRDKYRLLRVATAGVSEHLGRLLVDVQKKNLSGCKTAMPLASYSSRIDNQREREVFIGNRAARANNVMQQSQRD